MKGEVVEMNAHGLGQVRLETGEVVAFDVSVSPDGVPEPGASVEVEFGPSRLGGQRVSRVRIEPKWVFTSSRPCLLLKVVDGAVFVGDESGHTLKFEVVDGHRYTPGLGGRITRERKSGSTSFREERDVKVEPAELSPEEVQRVRKALHQRPLEEATSAWKEWEEEDSEHTLENLSELRRLVAAAKAAGHDVEHLMLVTDYRDEVGSSGPRNKIRLEPNGATGAETASLLAKLRSGADPYATLPEPLRTTFTRRRVVRWFWAITASIAMLVGGLALAFWGYSPPLVSEEIRLVVLGLVLAAASALPVALAWFVKDPALYVLIHENIVYVYGVVMRQRTGGSVVYKSDLGVTGELSFLDATREEVERHVTAILSLHPMAYAGQTPELDARWAADPASLRREGAARQPTFIHVLLRAHERRYALLFAVCVFSFLAMKCGL